MKKFAAVVESILIVVLVLIGVIGISYHSFRDGGWISVIFDKVVDAYITYPLVAIAVTVALYFVYRSWYANRLLGKGGKIFDYLVYVLMACGIYFAGYYLLRGKF